MGTTRLIAEDGSLSPFVSEFMVIAGSYARMPIVAGISTIAMVLSAIYILLTYQRTMTGPVTPSVAKTFAAHGSSDLSGLENPALAPLVVIILAFGVFPKPMLDIIEPAVQTTMQQVGMADPAAPLAKGSN